ncbi:hypothetical protein RhiirA1_509103 [Rhizophagus irregularis]|uniref:Serine-threonine/tyrosine-protein kinase catalytic domain-containing protein n=1 Tax=Rhizophagus irregularis TaxID=588596 RepID=A0A2N0RWF2_9GLOM|nr:hypothetical protein RhiirA1_509103 [Rhizophagus irregularis]
MSNSEHIDEPRQEEEKSNNPESIKVCIENRFLPSSSNYVCLFPDRGKNVESINRPEELTPQTPQEEGNLSPCFECENIMVTESNLAKLANFGTSREKHDATTTIGSQPERVRWLAPEKLKDNGRRYDHKCEIFSFGMNWLLVKIHTKILISDHVIAGGREIFPTHGTIEVMKRSLYKFKVYKIMYVSQLVTEDNRLKVWSQVTYGKNEECGVQEESGT